MWSTHFRQDLLAESRGIIENPSSLTGLLKYLICSRAHRFAGNVPTNFFCRRIPPLLSVSRRSPAPSCCGMLPCIRGDVGPAKSVVGSSTGEDGVEEERVQAEFFPFFSRLLNSQLSFLHHSIPTWQRDWDRTSSPAVYNKPPIFR